MEGFDSASHRSNSHHLSLPKWIYSASDQNDLAKPSGSEDIDGSVQTLKPQLSLVSESKEDKRTLSPYDRFKNSLTPRPKFLRYRPDRRSEIFTLLCDKEDEKEIGSMSNLVLSFSDEGEKSIGVESEAEEEEEEGSYGMKGLFKKLAWFVLILFPAAYLYHIDVSEVPAEGIDSHETGFFSWPTHNFTYQAASENKVTDRDGLYGEHSFLSGESECDYGNEVTLGRIKEEILVNFRDDQRLPEFEELSHSIIQNSRFADDYQENTALRDGAHEVQLKSEYGNELSAFDAPATESSHFEPGETIDEKFTSSKEYPTQAELETPKAALYRKIASVHGMIILSLSIPLLIASSLFLSMLMKRRSSPNIFPSQASKDLFDSQPVYPSRINAELQLPKEYQTVPCTSAVYPKNVEKASLAPGVELLGEFTFGGRGSSPKSNTVTKLDKTIDEQSINFISKEKSVLEVSMHQFIKFPSPGSSAFAKIVVDKGTNGSSRSTPTPLRRSGRLRNREFQSP